MNPDYCSKRVGDVDPGGVTTFLGMGGLSVRRNLNNFYRDNLMILLQVSWHGRDELIFSHPSPPL